MAPMIDRLFLEHPRKVGESYGEHMLFAFRFGLTLLGAGSAAMVHGLLPFLFETTASSTVKRLHARIANRGMPAASRPPSAEPGSYGEFCPQI